jgi:hypothetical protein
MRRAGTALALLVVAGPLTSCGTIGPQAPTPVTAQGPCGFNAITMSFRGDALEQARCLMRHVRQGGVLDEPADLPSALSARIGRPTEIAPIALRAYLHAQGIDEADIGGPVTDAMSGTLDGLPAAYFVIHDTSTPNLLDAPFPADMDMPSWAPNDVSVWRNGEASVAHVFIARTGISITAIEFSRGWRATKLESRVVGVASRGRFIHIENVQPRRSTEGGAASNDTLAPEPGFTDAQLQRLALVYIAASVRAGAWLVPAQHAVLDSGIADGHDDPQNFDLARWSMFVDQEANAIGVTSSQPEEPSN